MTMKAESNKKQVPEKVDSIIQYDEKLYVENDGGYPMKTEGATVMELCDALGMHLSFIEATLYATESAARSDMEIETGNILRIISEANRKMENVKKIHEEVFKRLG
jgi:hypothetical protein